MPKNIPPICPVCGQENDAANRYCSFCGTRFNLSLPPIDFLEDLREQKVEDTAPEATIFSDNGQDLPRLSDHPSWGAVPVLGILTIVPLGIFLWGITIDANDWPYAALFVFILFFFTLLIFLGQLWANVATARSFLTSGRPLLCWCYSPREWEIARSEQLDESVETMAEVAGCAVPFFAGLGTFLGAVLGSIEGFAGAVPGAAIGAVGGYLFGKILVPIATGLNQANNRQLYRVDLPVWVALAPGEIYYNRQYFRDDGMTDQIESITLEEGRQAWLRIETYAVRGSILNTFDGNIPVPARMLSDVQRILPELQKALTQDH